MLFRGWRLLASLSCAALIYGCGGSTAPGTSGAIVNPGAPKNPNSPTPQPIEGASALAPLGTTLDYAMTPIVPTVASTVPSTRSSSALGTGLTFLVQKATVTAATVTDPAAVNFDATGLQFDEGTAVNLWIQYETADNASFNWHWQLDTPPFDLQENHDEPLAGVHTAYMRVALPLDKTSDEDKNAHFRIDLDVKTTAAVIIVDGPSHALADFVIKNVPIDEVYYPPIEGGAYLAWEDLIAASDYDYNDLVCGLKAVESRRQTDGKVVQIDFRVKAIARGAGYDSDWQFNMDGAFPGATCTATIRRYDYQGNADGPMRSWQSTDGVSIPVLLNNQTDALPVPPDHTFATNVVPNTTWIDGDYADVTIVFDEAQTVGTYTKIPYKPQLRVRATSGTTYIVGLWTKRGDPVDNNGRPLGFVVPGHYAWPIEKVTIWSGYPRFNDWVDWVNNPALPDSAEPEWWNDTPVYASPTGSPFVYKPEYFLGNPKTMPVPF